MKATIPIAVSAVAFAIGLADLAGVQPHAQAANTIKNHTREVETILKGGLLTDCQVKDDASAADQAANANIDGSLYVGVGRLGNFG